MADTSIEWTRNPDGSPGKVWNPVVGCRKVSEGCRNCYAKTLHDRRHEAYQEGGGYWNNGQPIPKQYAEPFETVQLIPERLNDPLHWRKPQRVFVNSVSDLFHPDVPDGFIFDVFVAMSYAPQHTFMVLTKRPERMAEWCSARRWRNLGLSPAMLGDFYAPIIPGKHRDDDVEHLPNVWLGTSVENQEAADNRIPHLLETPAAVRFLSCEPLLGPVDLEPYLWEEAGPEWAGKNLAEPGIDWVIVGGESGLGARPMRLDWARDLRDQSAAADVPFFFKQWGEWFDRDQWEYNPELALPDDEVAYNGLLSSRLTRIERGTERAVMHRVGKKAAGRLLDGVEHSAFPPVHG